MTSEQRVWAASLLSAVILVVYANVLGRSVKQQQPVATGELAGRQAPEQAREQAQPSIPIFAQQEDRLTLESTQVALEIGKDSTSVYSIMLKGFNDLGTGAPLRVGNGPKTLLTVFGEQSARWDLIQQDMRRAVWTSQDPNGVSKELAIELNDDNPTYTIELVAKNSTSEPRQLPIKLVSSWSRVDAIRGPYNQLEAVFLTEKTSQWQRTHLVYREGVSQPRRVPRGTSLITLSERFFCQAINLDRGTTAMASVIPAEQGHISALVEWPIVVQPNTDASDRVTVYVGPRDFFRMRDAGFERAFALGFLAKIGMGMLLFLKLVASVVKNYGVAVILLSAVITTALSPFTLISFRSMKKMQALQPKLEAIKKKYEGDSQRVNKEMMAMFREHKVSPLSGCLPMLIQLPLFFALWSAITHVIELRGAPFLWIKDLSLPDRLAKLPLGLDLNILPILMAGAMYLQTKMSQQTTSKTTQGLMLSGPMMSIIFGFMFYQVPSGLVLYWLTNSTTSIIWYRIARV